VVDLISHATSVRKLAVTNTERWGRLEWQAVTLNGDELVLCYFSRWLDGTYPDSALIWTVRQLRDEVVAESRCGTASYLRMIAALGDTAAHVVDRTIELAAQSNGRDRAARKSVKLNER